MDLRPNRISISSVVKLKQQGAINDSEYLKVIEWVSTPPSRAKWRTYFHDWFLLLGLTLVVAGIIMFGAYNWDGLGRFQKLGLLEFLVLASWADHHFRGANSTQGKVLLFSSSLLVGALLAVFGQIYQTGADDYQLFLSWGILILPWCLSSSFSLNWLLEFLLLNLSLWLFWMQTNSGDAAGYTLAAAALNLTIAWLWERERTKRSWMPGLMTNLLIAASLWGLSATACLSFWEGGIYWVCLIAILALSAILGYIYRNKASVLGIIYAALIPVSLAFLLWLLAGLEALNFLTIALILAIEATWASKSLHAVSKRTSTASAVKEKAAPDSTKPTILEVLAKANILDPSISIESRNTADDPPSYIGCVTVFAAWLASFFIIGFVALLFPQGQGELFLGVILWAGSLAASRLSTRMPDFFVHLVFAINIAGLIIIPISMDTWFEWDTTSALGIEFILILGSLIGYQRRAAKTFFSFCLVPVGASFSWQLTNNSGFDSWILLITIILCCLLIDQKILLKEHLRDLHQSMLTGMSWGVLITLAGKIIATYEFRSSGPSLLILEIGLTLLVVGCALYLQAPISSALALATLCFFTSAVPGLPISILFFILAFHSRNQAIWWLSVLGLLGFGVLYYYSLKLSLLYKSIALIASGITFLVARRSLRNQSEALYTEDGLAL